MRNEERVRKQRSSNSSGNQQVAAAAAAAEKKEEVEWEKGRARRKRKEEERSRGAGPREWTYSDSAVYFRIPIYVYLNFIWEYVNAPNNTMLNGSKKTSRKIQQ